MSLESGTGVCEKKVALLQAVHVDTPGAPKFQSWIFLFAGVDPPAKKKKRRFPSAGHLAVHLNLDIRGVGGAAPAGVAWAQTTFFSQTPESTSLCCQQLFSMISCVLIMSRQLGHLGQEARRRWEGMQETLAGAPQGRPGPPRSLLGSALLVPY